MRVLSWQMVRAVKPHPRVHAVDGLIRRAFSTAFPYVAPPNQKKGPGLVLGERQTARPRACRKRNNPFAGCSVCADLGAVPWQGLPGIQQPRGSQSATTECDPNGQAGRIQPDTEQNVTIGPRLRPLKSEGRPVRETPLLGWGAQVVRDMSAHASQPYLPKAGLSRDDQLGKTA